MIRFDRLRQLEQHLRSGKLGHERFDFGIYNSSRKSECGTAGCAIGECPVLWPDDWRFAEGGFPTLNACLHDDSAQAGQDWFEIDEMQYEHLFTPDGQDEDEYGGQRLSPYATAVQVADNIAAFIETKEVPA